MQARRNLCTALPNLFSCKGTTPPTYPRVLPARPQLPVTQGSGLGGVAELTKGLDLAEGTREGRGFQKKRPPELKNSIMFGWQLNHRRLSMGPGHACQTQERGAGTHMILL